MKNFYRILFLLLSISIFAFGQTNVITNGGMENWTAGVPDNWALGTNGFDIFQNSDTVYAGSNSAKIVLLSTDTQNMNQNDIPIVGGAHYVLQMRVYDNDPFGRVRFWGYWDGATGGPQPSFYTSDSPDWQLYEFEIDAPATATGLDLQIRFYDQPGFVSSATFFIDEVAVLAPSTSAPIMTNITTGHFDAGIGINIDADITDDQGIDEVWLHFSTDLGATEDSVQMSNITGDTYQGTIPAQTNNTTLQYWVSATDIDATTNYSTSNVFGTIIGIADISRAHELDANGNMLYDNFLAKIKGVVTVATGTFSSTAQDDYVQDNTGGINVFDFAVIQTLALGDSVEVEGKFSSYNGKSEIVEFSINVLNSGNPVPAPTVITTIDMAEQYEGMLIRINQGLISAWDSTTTSSFTANFTDASGDLDLRVDSDTDIPGHAAPTNFIDLIGIGSQFDFSSPYTDGYNITPRSWADFIITSSIEEPNDTPFEFSLKQNYPNPFNPNTKIEFTLAKNSDVKMVIYNLLGQEVKSFVVRNLAKGSHHFNWNGTDNKGFDVASGIYIYRLTANDFVSTKKMALLR